MDDARALLNSLMGADRNAHPEQRRTRKFTDGDICRNFLLGLCPHDLFPNTKIDLGPCDKHHNDQLREDFEADSSSALYRRKWRGGLRQQLKSLLQGVDRRIESNKERIAREKDSVGVGANEEQKKQLAALKDEVSQQLQQAEKLADEGKFDESRNAVKEAENTKRKLEDLENKRYEKYRKENYCEICGLIIDDEEAEAMKTGRGWHSNGKQHIGYARIRDFLKQIDEEQAKDRANGTRTPSPSPVKVKPDPPKAPKVESKRRKSSRSPSPAKGQKAESKRAKGGPSRSRSRGKTRRSKSRRGKAAGEKRAKASRSRSPPAKGRKTGPKADGKKRGSPSPSHRRSRSRRKRDRKKAKSRSRDRSRSRSRERSKAKVSKRSSSQSRSGSSSPSRKKGKKAKKSSKAAAEPEPSEEPAPAAAEPPEPPPPPEVEEAPAVRDPSPEPSPEPAAKKVAVQAPVRFFLGLRRQA